MDQFLKDQLKKYGIDPNSVVEQQHKKEIDKDKRWDLFLKFFKEVYPDVKIFPTKSQNLILFVFDDDQHARQFMDSPTIGLLAYTRQSLKSEGLNPKEYNLNFNFSVNQDDQQKRTNAVMLRIL